MEAPVVLRFLQETIPRLDISQDGMQAQLINATDLRNVIYRATLSYDPKRDVWTLKNAARLRYKLNVRFETYLHNLGIPLGEAGIFLYMSHPCLMGIGREYPESVFGETATEFAIATYLYHELRGFTILLATMSRVANLCSRLPERGGTHKYKKLLPSRLAALTLCGRDGTCH